MFHHYQSGGEFRPLKPALVLPLIAVLSALGMLPAGVARSGEAPRYAVIIVLDGARASYLHRVPMPNLEALQRRGITYTSAFTGQELANTPPSHATIGTGLFPKHHGVEGFLWEDPRTHRVDDPTQSWNVIAGRLEAVIAGHRVPTLAGQLKKTYPHATLASVAAHKCYASDAMGGPRADYILCALIYKNRWVAQAIANHRPPPGAINNSRWDVPIPSPSSGFGAAVQQWPMGRENGWTTKYALWAFNRVHYPRVLMVNLSETDVLGHFAPNASIIPGLMRQIDYLIGTIVESYRRAGILDQTDFVITADHGMSKITAHVPYHVLWNAIGEAGARPVYMEHDTAAAIGIEPDSKAHAVATAILRNGGTGVDATFYKVHMNGTWSYQLAASQPDLPGSYLAACRILADTMASDEGPDVFVVFAPHVSTRQFKAHGYPWVAGHLGPQWGDQHIPLIIAGPGVKQGVISSYPARLVDIAPTVERLLGVPTGRVDGVVLADALTHPSAARVAAQEKRGNELRPIQLALKARAATH
jgi:arylsulfatase A-like enzyme